VRVDRFDEVEPVAQPGPTLSVNKIFLAHSSSELESAQREDPLQHRVTSQESPYDLWFS
jgi:hypothetical protein